MSKLTPNTGLDPNMMGSGGGMGRYQGLEVDDIAQRFAACESEVSMRAVTAILRIAREQIQARGSLRDYPRTTAFLGVVSAIVLAVMPFLPAETRQSVMPVAIGGPLVTLAFGYGSLSTLRARKASNAQEREIVRLATESLERVLRHEFPRKPLQREQVDTLQTLLKHAPNSTALRSLLDTPA